MRICIVDAANNLYRAFFAPFQPLQTADGFPTKAIYVFANMLRKVLREESPDIVLAAWDPPGGSFRKELFDGYKANRDAQPEDLTRQIPVARELLEAHGIPIIEVPGFEADDVVATLVREAPADAEIVIVSTDKDLMQLVSDRVVLLDTMKDRRIGPAEVEERFGVPPEQVLDLRALVGDPSDNIPGVKGIGEKGAAKLVAEWGTLEALLENAGEIKAKKAREGLLEQADEARLSKELATLRDDVPLPIDLAAVAFPTPDPGTLRALYKRLEFARLAEEIDDPGAADEAAGEVAVEVVATRAALDAAVAALVDAEAIAVVLVGDPEQGGRVPQLAGLAAAGDGARGCYVPFAQRTLLDETEIDTEMALAAFEPLLCGASARPWGARNAKRVQTLFAQHELETTVPSFDLELLGFLIDPAGVRATAPLGLAELGRNLRSWEEVAGRGAKAIPAAEVPIEAVSRWAAEEAATLFALVPRLRARLERDGTDALYEDVELPLTAVLSQMERTGVRIDGAKLKDLSTEYESELTRIEGRITALAGERFAVNSPKQLQRILFEKLKLSPTKKTKTGFSTDESVLEQLSAEHELPGEVLAFRRLTKLKSTYIDALPPLVDERTGRIHPTFHQTGAATGRLSSSHPNVQNIPIRTAEGIRIREAFIAADGHTLLAADYSQVELRILAHYSADANLIEAFAAGEDIHRRTAAEVNEVDAADVSDDQRAAAKAINFGIIYGSSAFGISNQLGIAQAEAQEMITRYFARYEGVRRFLDETVEEAKKDGFVRTLLGRRRYLSDLGSRNRVMRQAAERMAVNTVIQGTAADLIKKAMVDAARALHESALDAAMILQVHDELVFEVAPEDVDGLSGLVRECMESVYALDVPLLVEIGVGSDWRAAH